MVDSSEKKSSLENPQTLESLLAESRHIDINTNTSSWQKREASEKVLQQIHPIFLTTHTEPRTHKEDTKFDKVLSFLRLMVEAVLKVFDILIDAVVQIMRIFVWIIAIVWVLIVATLMTNTTDKFIDLINHSVLQAIGSDIQIQKTPSVSTDTETVSSMTPDAQNSPTGDPTISSSFVSQ